MSEAPKDVTGNPAERPPGDPLPQTHVTEPPKSHRKFLGRDWQTPGHEPRIQRVDGAAAAPPALPVAGTAMPAVSPPPLSITRAEREAMFKRYAELRLKLGETRHDPALLVEAARLAEELELVLEAMEMWQECMRLDPSNVEANRQLAKLDRRAAATGETGRRQSATHKPKEQAPEAPPFWTDLGAVLTFPLRGKGPGVMIAGALSFAVFEIMATFNIFVGGFMVLAIWGYLAGWQFDVISRSAAGKDDPAEFPEFATIYDSCVAPLLSFAGCVLFSYAPVMLALGLTWKGWLPTGPGLIVALVLMVPCAFVFPMSLAVRSLFESTSEAMRPSRVYGAIVRILPDYILAFVSLAVLWSAWAVVRSVVFVVLGFVFGLPTPDAVFQLDFVRILGWLIYTLCVWPLLLYVWAVQGYVLGRVYCQSYRRLAWFVAPGVETARARKMSAGVIVAGVVGAAVLVGGAFLTWKMGPGGASAAVVKGGGRCPVPAGGSLTYFWENTDGPAGMTTYTFTAQGKGRLHVEAESMSAEAFGISRHKQSVGIIDAQTGVVVRTDNAQSAIPYHEKRDDHTRFFGPPRMREAGSYINEWSIRGALRYQDRWIVVKVIDPESSAELYYDKASGLLVGRKFGGVGFVVTEWLIAAEGVPGMTNLPAPNRTFATEDQTEEGDEFPFGIDTPEEFRFEGR